MKGTWKKQKTAADGVWQTRNFSKNHTFIVNDIDLGGALLAWCHACMRGKCDGDTEIKWGGTSKVMEGHCASVCYNEIKGRGGAVEKNWLDGDASSEKEVHAVFPDAICVLLSGKSHEPAIPGSVSHCVGVSAGGRMAAKSTAGLSPSSTWTPTPHRFTSGAAL